LYELLKKIIPRIDQPGVVKSINSSACVLDVTPTGYPYIAIAQPGLGIVTGGNGYLAKSSDETGRIAAKMMVEGQLTRNATGKMNFIEIMQSH
jgi:glycine/D-amino acid oxidase-like deaminating enzyme